MLGHEVCKTDISLRQQQVIPQLVLLMLGYDRNQEVSNIDISLREQQVIPQPVLLMLGYDRNQSPLTDRTISLRAAYYRL